MSESGKAVFLSYASQDAEAAKRICDALRAAGVEVWFDQSELVGGDAWDQKIRKQIKDCALLIPVISAGTQQRTEGYFRLEWRLADQRTHLMAKGRPFLLPVVIDDTRDAEAQVPDSFTEVQWTRLPGGEAPDSFCARVKKLLAGDASSAGLRPPVAEMPRPRRKNSPWFTAGIVVLPLLTGLILAWWVLPGGRRAALKSSSGQSAGHAVSPPAAPLSAARQLVERALTIADGDNDKSSANLGAAAELCEQAKALDPTDAEVWAAAARIDGQLVALRFDASEARRQRAQQAAAKAVVLAPDSRTARRAQAYVFANVIGTPEIVAEAATIYRGLLRETPEDRALLSELGRVLFLQGLVDEGAALFEKAANPIEAGWGYFGVGRFAEANMVADRLLAGKRSIGALYLKAHVELFGFEDPVAAQKTVSELPQSELQTENGAAITLLVGLHRHDPDLILRVLSAFPNEFLDKQGFAGPKRIWTGMAHEMAGRPEAAVAEWTVALQQCMDRRKDKPNEPTLLMAEATLRVSLGQREEAERVYRLFLNLSGLGPSKRLNLFCLWILLRFGKPEEALAGMTAELQAKHPGWEIMHANLRFTPLFDALRGDPRFEKFLRDTLPPDAKPFEDQKTEDSGQTSYGAGRTTGPGLAEISIGKTAVAVDAKSVAVLAFANLSDDKANEYFSDGISEELLNVLAKIPDLKVTARTSSFHFKGTNTAIPEIARQLGVAYVVEGSVRKQGDKVRITAQLIKAADGFHVWSDTFTRELKDIFAVQDEIAGLIAKNLELKMGTVRSVAAVSPEVLELYLRARVAWAQRTLEGFAVAEQLLNRAIELDPNFTRAYAGLVDVWTIRAIMEEKIGDFGQRRAPEFDRIERAIQRSLALDPESSEALASLGFARYLAWRLPEAEQAYRHAIAANPNNPAAHHWLGTFLGQNARYEESIVELRRAAALDPISSRIVDNLGWVLRLAGRNDEALAALDRALVLQPNSQQALRGKASLLLTLNRRPEALETARGLNGDEAAVFWREAGTAAERSAALVGADGLVRYWLLVELGRVGEALDGLRADDIAATGIAGWLDDRALDPFRRDPRLLKIVSELGLGEVHARILARIQATPPKK